MTTALTPTKPKTGVNVELLNETLAYIETHPEDWRQGEYRCGSGMCFAGWAATLSGREWLVPDPDSMASNLLSPEGDEEPSMLRGGVHVHEVAERLLGLTDDQGFHLFAGLNTLEDIRRIVAELTK